MRSDIPGQPVLLLLPLRLLHIRRAQKKESARTSEPQKEEEVPSDEAQVSTLGPRKRMAPLRDRMDQGSLHCSR